MLTIPAQTGNRRDLRKEQRQDHQLSGNCHCTAGFHLCMGIIKAKIDEAKPAELVKIYTADSDEAFEEAYQNYMNLLDKIGVQELNSYMTEKVKEVREQFGF